MINKLNIKYFILYISLQDLRIETRHTDAPLTKYVEHVCEEEIVNKTDGKLEQYMFKKMRLIPSKKFLYCPVEKVGSTFWWRVMYMLERPLKGYKHPFEVPIPSVLTLKHTGYDPRGNYIDWFRFMFARNPYSRLLSIYVDKLLVPNPVHWKMNGKDSIQMFRKNASRMSLKCGHDPSFLEYVQFVVWSLQTGKKIDNHFRTASEMCMPCRMNFSFIGKMENGKDDFIYVLKQFGLDSVVRVMGDRFHNLTAEDAIVDSITAPYGWKKNILICMNWNEALMRVWRKLQIRGLVGLNQLYPLNETRAQTIEAKEFIHLAMKARERSSNYELKNQKKKIFESIYRTIPDDVLSQIRDVYSLDFKLFGYVDSPNAFFSDRTSKNLQYDYINFRN